VRDAPPDGLAALLLAPPTDGATSWATLGRSQICVLLLPLMARRAAAVPLMLPALHLPLLPRCCCCCNFPAC
jgi:hypothetical protein